MNNIVFKYPLKPIRSGSQTVRMPMGAEILDCQIQDGLFVIWVLASKEYYEKDLMENRTLVILHTDEHTPHCLTNHISTIQSHGVVYHIFEVGSCH